MRESTTELRQGTLDMLILKALSLEPTSTAAALRSASSTRRARSWQRESRSRSTRRCRGSSGAGSSPAEWRASDNNRRSKILPAAHPPGRAQLSREQKDWERFMGAVQRIMRAV